MKYFSANILDDRGIEVPLVRASLLPKHADSSLRRTLSTAHAGTWRHVVLCAVGAAIGVTLSRSLSLLKPGSHLNAGDAMMNALWMTIAMATAGFVFSLTRGPHYRRLARTKCLSRGICPSCGYALHAVPESAAGLRVCPECGAAWRLRSGVGLGL
jgi:hypothetical protein